MSNLPENVLNRNPNGTWGFVGSVSAVLAYCQNDGTPATDEQLERTQQFGPRLAHVKPRVFASKEAALTALAQAEKPAIADARKVGAA